MEVSTVQEEIDLATDSPLEIKKTGLYTPFPPHAYRILIKAREHIAKDVLTCLVSHLGHGKTNKAVNPSYTTICRESGRGRASVASGIRTLEEFGFIKTFKYRTAHNIRRNRYYIQESCYHAHLMSDKARAFLPIFGRCQCGGAVKQGEYGIGGDGYHHYGCGDLVFPLKSRQKGESVAVKVADVVNDTYSQYLQSTDSPFRGSEN